MNLFRRTLILLAGVVVTLAASPSAHACSACFGKSNDKMLTAYYIGAVVLVGLVAAVLGGITTFFVYIARRSSRLDADQRSTPGSSATP